MSLIIGTAGHIDHGKTSLVRALTGQETDRLREERERGISIDLGFAWLDSPRGERVGVVDVPGHERFVKNMLAGAHGIDLVLFTVAADDGVMPQTEEHLDIIHLLGVRRGIFVITKVDLADAQRVTVVREEIEILALDTVLEGAPILPVSTVTGEGLDALRAAITTQLDEAGGPPPTGYFRLPVDRAFVMHGHGVVVTGTATAGEVAVGDSVRVLPDGGTARVRGLEVHGREVARARQGQRVAINLGGIERIDIGRGHVVCHERITRTTNRFDAWIEVRPGAPRPLRHHGRVRVHVGTAEVLGKLVLLDGAVAIAPRDAGWAQVVLAEPVVVLRGDRFVLRDETARWTVGGGEVVSAFAERHRARDGRLAEQLAVLRGTDLVAAAGTLLELSGEFASDRGSVAEGLNVADGEARRALAAVPGVIVISDGHGVESYTTVRKWERLRGDILGAVERLHTEQPTATGAEMESLRGRMSWDVAPRVFRWCIDRLVAEKRLVRDDSLVRSPAHKVGLDAAARGLAEKIERLLAAGRFTPPDLRQLEEQVHADRRRLVEVLGVLETERRVVRVAPDLYFSRDAADEVLSVVAAHCREHGEITAALLRDRINASRKYAIAFLDWCDRTGATIRVGDVRRLRR